MKPKSAREVGLFYGIIAGMSGAFGIEFFTLLEYSTLLAGPAVILSLLLCGILNMLTMFTYCELGSSISRLGSEYTFTKASFGGFISFLTGWLRWVACIFTVALSAIGFAQMVNYFLPVNTQLVAIFIIILFTVMNIRGIRQIDLVVIAVFVSVFAIFDTASILQGLTAKSFEPFMPNGLMGALAGVMYSFSIFFGVRTIVVESPNMENPERNVPRSIFFSSLSLIVIYCSVAFFVVGAVEFPVETSIPLLTLAAERLMGPIGGALLNIAGISAAVMSMTTAMSVQTSIISAMSRDGYMPKIVLMTRSRFGTRYLAVILGSILAILFATSGLAVFVGYVVNFTSLLIFGIVNLSLIRLRKSMPRLIRPFKTPLYPYTPIVGALVGFVLLIFVESTVLALGIEFILITIIVYHLRMVGYSRLRLAIGGINFGISGLIALFLVLLRLKIMQLPWLVADELYLSYSAALLSVLFFLAGVLNLNSKKKT